MAVTTSAWAQGRRAAPLVLAQRDSSLTQVSNHGIGNSLLRSLCTPEAHTFSPADRNNGAPRLPTRNVRYDDAHQEQDYFCESRQQPVKLRLQKEKE